MSLVMPGRRHIRIRAGRLAVLIALSATDSARLGSASCTSARTVITSAQSVFRGAFSRPPEGAALRWKVMLSRILPGSSSGSIRAPAAC
jgi:hypothetical protein